MVANKIRTKYDRWCYTVSKSVNRRKLKRLKSKAYRQKEKEYVDKEYNEGG